MIDIEAYKLILRSRLTEKRYVHSLGVMDSAKALAERYGADVEKAVTAGLLHDITKKCSDEEHMELFKRFSVNLDDGLAESKKIWHSVSGAYYVKYELGIDDEDIFNAIRYHTTGRAGMSLLEKIVYVADFIEPNRSYDEVCDLRRIAFENLDAAVYEGVKWCIIENVEKNYYIYKDTFGLYNDCLKK